MLKTQSFCWSVRRNIEIATNNGKMYIPKLLSKSVIYWYHTYLIYPGVTRTTETINQHLYWTRLKIEVRYEKNMRLANSLRRKIVSLTI